MPSPPSSSHRGSLPDRSGEDDSGGVESPPKRRLRFHIEKHQTLREKIVDSIREAIVRGGFQAGERIAEPEIAKQFGISRTPIREAFRQLESEGFLTIIPRKGAVVTSVTEDDIREFYEIKAVLEGHAARVATERVTEKDIDKMKGLNDQLARAIRDRSKARELQRLHNEFHEVFLSACGNAKLYRLVRNLVQQFQRFRITLAVTGKLESALKQHRQIIDAFAERNADLAEKLVRENAVLGGETLIREVLQRTVGSGRASGGARLK